MQIHSRKERREDRSPCVWKSFELHLEQNPLLLGCGSGWMLSQIQLLRNWRVKISQRSSSPKKGAESDNIKRKKKSSKEWLLQMCISTGSNYFLSMPWYWNWQVVLLWQFRKQSICCKRKTIIQSLFKIHIILMYKNKPLNAHWSVCNPFNSSTTKCIHPGSENSTRNLRDFFLAMLPTL